jgi:exo-beta-1,3-glucanase (GH17 family)
MQRRRPAAWQLVQAVRRRVTGARIAFSVLPLPLLLLSLAMPVGPRTTSGTPTYVYAQHPCTAVYAAPSTGAVLLTQLLGGSELTVAGARTTVDGVVWDHISLWSGLDAYVAASDVASTPPANAEEGNCAYPGLPDALAAPLSPQRGPWPLQAHGHVAVAGAVLAAPSADAFPVTEAALGTALSMSQWAGDAAGRPWYEVSIDATTGWIPASNVQVDEPSPATYKVNGVPVWEPAAGKGMWFTNYLPHHSDVDALVQAARLAGLTHLYAEVAVSTFGFYGQNTLDRLLPAAHAAGLKVIAAVYPYLNDIATDVRLTQEVADYRTPSGDRIDGILTDVEEVTTESAVYSYGQTLRAVLGPDLLLVADVLHPLADTGYPYGAIAASWNVIEPMDYWHGQHNHTYSAADTTRFVTTTLTTVRAAVGQMPIEELGQSYDMYTDDGTGGGDAPTAQEMTADLQAARAPGCIGVSYFEWQTATQAEWRALAAYDW